MKMIIPSVIVLVLNSVWARAVGTELCNQGFEFCPAISSCIPTMCRLGVGEGEVCPLGSLPCGHELCVQSQCLSLVLSKERKKLAQPFPVKRKRKIFPFDEDDYEEEYGFRRKKRSHEAPSDDTAGERDERFQYLSCPAGKVFCLESNRCSDECGGGRNELDSFEFGDEDEDFGNDDEYDDDDDDPDSYIRCPTGTTFCMSEMKCSENCGGFDKFIDDPEDDDDIDIELDYEPTVCPSGQVFCLQVMACVSNCGFFFDEEDDVGPGVPDLDITVTCPEGMVFCMSSSQCIPSEASCQDSDGPIKVPDQVCPPGLVWCGPGQGCQATCEDTERCPARDLVPTQAQSTCQVAAHCPDNSSCCTDDEGFRQCVPHDLSSASLNYRNWTQLALLPSVCSTAPEDLSVLAGWECSQEAGVCGPGAVCCEGVCHGLPTLNQTLSDQCPAGRFYCNVTGGCLSPLEWSCGASCGPGLVQCGQTCEVPLLCPDNTRALDTIQAVWMMPVSTVSQDQDQEVSIKLMDVYRDLNNTLVGGNSLTIISSKQHDGVEWDPDLKEGSQLSSESDIKILIRKGSPPGYSDITFEHKTGAKYSLVHVLLPALPPPKVTGLGSVEDRSVNFSISVNEDEKKIIKLQDFVNFEEDPSTVERLPEFQQMFAEFVGYYGSALLDGQFDYVKRLSGFLSSGQRQMGYELNIAKNISKSSEYKAKIYRARKSAKWSLQDPRKSIKANISLSDITGDNDHIQLRPDPDYFGQTAVVIRPYAVSWNGSEEYGGDIRGAITVNPVNDAPMALRKINSTLPMVSQDTDLNSGILVSDFASLFYEDVDSDSLGLALLYADSPDWGSWQYQEAGGAWTDLTELSTWDMDKAWVRKVYKKRAHRGPVAMTKLVSDLVCKESFDSTVELEEKCFEDIKCKHDKDKKRSKSLETPSESELGRNLRKLVSDDTILSAEDTEDLSFNVRALLLSPNWLLRFQPQDNSKAWTTFEAMDQTRLVFTAWDGAGAEAGQRLNVSLPWCCQCGAARSLARDLSVFYIDKEDCTGGPVITQAKERDQCGVCGGDGTSCLDCNQVVNGPGVLECGQCFQSQAAASEARDCAGSCGLQNVVIQVAGEDVCVPETGSGNFSLCDGSSDSDAKINECGVCYGGNTGETSTAGKDECGACEGARDTSSGCGCDEERDDCGVCQVKGAGQWNACRKNFVSLDGYNVDKILSSFVQVSLLDDGIKNKTKEPWTLKESVLEKNWKCMLEDYKNNEISRRFDSVLIKKGSIKLGIEDPPKGSYRVKCFFKPMDFIYETGENDILTIANSLDIVVNSITTQEDSNGTNSVQINADLNHQDIDKVYCFYRKAKNLKGSLMLDSRIINNKMTETEKVTEIDCGEFNPNGGGVYQFGILLTQSKQSLRNPRLSVTELVTTTKGPVAKKAHFAKNYAALVIKFSKNIQGVPEDCGKIFSGSSTILGKGPTCSSKANILEVVLGEEHTVQNGTVLRLAKGNGIKELKAEDDFAPEATGSVAVIIRKADNDKSPEFSISGPSEICPDSPVTVTLSNMKGIGRGRQLIDWNVTSQDGNQLDTSRYAGSRKIKIEPAQLEDGKNYIVSVSAKNKFTSRATTKNITLTRVSTNAMSVEISGPSTIRSDQILRLKAKSKICGSESSAASTFSHFWSSDGPVGDLTKKSHKKLKLEKGVLEGGRRYNFSVVVLSSNANVTGSAWTIVEVDSLGPQAVLSANKVTYGTMSKIILDATLSEDRDNGDGNLRFQWSCSTSDSGASSGGCFVYSGTSQVRLEEYLASGTLSSDYVVLEPKTLVPGEYLFTVTVSKNNMTSVESMEVIIIPGSPPTISPVALQRKYNPDEGITVNAVISGSEGTCVQWESAVEEGFVFLDLSLISKSSKLLCFKRDVPNRDFPLVLPDPGLTWRGLKPGAKYKFLVTASHPSLGSSEASVIIETLSPPSKGQILVTPEKGQGVKTKFTIEASDFYDEDVPLSYKFGYKKNETDDVVWFKKISSSVPSIETFLPATEAALEIIVEVCDAFDICVTEKSPKVAVSAAELSDEEILLLASDVTTKAADQECPESLSLLTQVLDTVSLNKKQAETKMPDLCDLYSEVLGQCVQNVAANLQCGDIETGQELISFYIRSPCRLDFSTVEASSSLAGSLASLAKDCAASEQEVSSAAVRTERIGFVIADIESETSLTNSRKPVKLGFTRRKRQTLANFVNNLVQTLSVDDIEQYMNVALKTIDAIEVAIEEDEALNNTVTELKDKHRDYLTNLLDDIHTNYMAEMCRGATSLSAPDTVRAGDISVTMVKTELNKGADEKFVFDNTKRSLFDASSVQLMEGVYNQFSQWDCGKRDASGEVSPCVGLCLGTAVLEEDIVTPTSDLLESEGSVPPLVSKIHDIRILNPVTGADLTRNIQTDKLAEPLAVQINIENSTRRKGYEFRCHVFVESAWTAGPCNTTSLSVAPDNTVSANCDCSVPGFIAVFLTLGNAPLMQMASSPVQNKTITFTINADYYAVVEPNKEAFEARLRQQLANLLNTEDTNIQNLRTWAGSIEVSFNLVADSQLDASTQAAALQQFQDMIGSGQLALTDQNGNILDVPSQCVNNCPVEIIGDDVIPIIIAAAAAALVIFILIFICCAICMKNKKTEEKLKPLTPPSQTPTYRAFQFADSLEGTKASLQRHSRKNSSVPDYMPSNFNSRVQTQSSAVLTEELAEAGGLLAIEAGALVPVAARYKTPTPDQISSTQPIPDHIMARARQAEDSLMRDQLPGTPE